MYSKHALEKIDSFGLDIGEIEQVIRSGMKWKEEKTNKWHVSMGGIECVFMKEESTIFIITVYKEGVEK